MQSPNKMIGSHWQIFDECESDGIEYPSDTTFATFGVICAKLFKAGYSDLLTRCESDVYADDKGSLTLDLYAGPEGGRYSVIIICKDRFINVLAHVFENTRGHSIYSMDVDEFPDDRVMSALDDFYNVVDKFAVQQITGK